MSFIAPISDAERSLMQKLFIKQTIRTMLEDSLLAIRPSCCIVVID
ncbi:Uncharacterised protein [Serratia fonticola]|nr:Uncharacterised protein [Serratia fonticola]